MKRVRLWGLVLFAGVVAGFAWKRMARYERGRVQAVSRLQAAVPDPVKKDGPDSLHPSVEALASRVDICVRGGQPSEIDREASLEDEIDWATLRRESFSFWKRIRKAGATLDYRRFLRHTALNPRDVPISLARQRQLAAIHARFQPVMYEAMQVRGAVTAEELTGLIESGETVVRPVGKTGSPRLDYGPEFARKFKVSRRVGDVVHYAASESMPGTRIARDLEAYLASEYATQVVGWFASIGCISSEECSELMRLVHK